MGCGFWFCKSRGLGNGDLVWGFLSQWVSGCCFFFFFFLADVSFIFSFSVFQMCFCCCVSLNLYFLNVHFELYMLKRLWEKLVCLCYCLNKTNWTNEDVPDLTSGCCNGRTIHLTISLSALFWVFFSRWQTIISAPSTAVQVSRPQLSHALGWWSDPESGFSRSKHQLIKTADVHMKNRQFGLRNKRVSPMKSTGYFFCASSLWKTKP